MKIDDYKFKEILLLAYRVLCALMGVLVLNPNIVSICGFHCLKTTFVFTIYIIFHFLLTIAKWNSSIKVISGQLIDLSIVATFLFTTNNFDIYLFSFVFLLLTCKDIVISLRYRLILYLGIPFLLYFHNPIYSIKIFLPFLFFFSIAYVNYKIFQMGKESRKLVGMIDDLFLSANGKVHELYKRTIESVSKMNLLSIKLKHIYCFRWENEHFYLVNGSRFVWSYNIKESKEKLTKIFGADIYNNLNIEIETSSFDNICFVVHPESVPCTYLFLLECDKKSFLTNYYAKILFYSFFKRLTIVLESDRKFKDEQRKELMEMSKKVNYVNTSMNTMHFIRNKMSPLKNYIAMYDDYIQSTDDIKAKIKPHMDKEFLNVKRSFQLINGRAEKLLEEQKNPFVFSVTNRYGFQQLFSEIKIIWQSYGLDENKIIVSLFPKSKNVRKSVFYNKEGLILILDNWVSNMVKYGDENYGLQVVEKDNELLVSFSNKYKMKSHECDKLIQMFNNNDRFEINKRNYHGLETIKDVLAQMRLESELCIVDDKLNLIIKFYIQVEEENNEESIDYRG